ncbi:S-adenosyl-L-methionine dependent methyltransferase [Trametes punicea]|nr:S-adenosyl-L-methionine dependent methyltransferase [Trametes punicea]
MEPSAAVYSKFLLWIYDFIVLGFTNRFAWRCSIASTLLPFYQRHLGEHAHLEIGVGTGYFPAHSASKLAKTKLVTLLDLNPNTLQMGRSRLVAAGYKGAVETLERSVFDPLPESMRGKYDSVALFYIFHCLPGAFPQKADKVFGTVIPALAPGGVVFGSTVLGRGADHNWLSKTLVRLHNRKGIFGNRDDMAETLRIALDRNFQGFNLRIEGVVALFTARKPKAMRASRS